MSSVPLHPALVHVPIGLSLVVPLVVVLLLVASRRGFLPGRAWWVAVALQAIVLGGGAAAFLAGQREEHRVERVVPETVIEEHEERAEVFLWAAGLTLALGAAAGLLPGATASIFRGLALAGALATAGLALHTGKAGGELVYRHGAARAWVDGADAAARIAVEEGGEHGRRHALKTGRD